MNIIPEMRHVDYIRHLCFSFLKTYQIKDDHQYEFALIGQLFS